MSEVFGGKEDKKQMIKDLIKELHAGAKPGDVKEKFKEILKEVGPTDIAQIEEELVKEGMPSEELQRLCDVHLAVFKESLEKEKTLAPPGHPVHTLMEEHKIILRFADELKSVTQEINRAENFDSAGEGIRQLEGVSKHLDDAESHYVREENVLFPYLEKHGITQPPAIMWSEHTELREKKKKLHDHLRDLQKVDHHEL